MQNRMSDIDNKIIKDYLTGKATAGEMEQLAEWLGRSEENRKDFFGTELAYHLGKPNPLATPEKIEEAENRLMNEIAVYEKARRRHAVFRLLRYAAAVLMAAMLVGGGLFAYLYRSVKTITVAALDEVKKVTLPDRSTVWLNKGAVISYADRFEGDERKVDLKGEALFHVKRNPEKPFVVNGEEASAKVLGTTFNFKGQDARGQEVISLIEGRLEVTGHNGQGKVILRPNQKATVSKDAKTIRTENSYAAVDAVWRDNMIPFDNMRIKQIAQLLEQLYGCKVVIDPALDNRKTYTGVIKKSKDVRNVLEGLSYTISFRYTIKGNEIRLSR